MDFAEHPFDDDWPTFAETVLEATRVRPAEMCPQVAPLICNTTDGISPQHSFDRERAERLFGDPDAVLDIFEAATLPPHARTPMVEEVIRAAAARKPRGE